MPGQLSHKAKIENLNPLERRLIPVILTLEGVLRFNLANIKVTANWLFLSLLDTNGKKNMSQIFDIPTKSFPHIALLFCIGVSSVVSHSISVGSRLRNRPYPP